jgi:O-antigen/teichoic acid export membrane protein
MSSDVMERSGRLTKLTRSGHARQLFASMGFGLIAYGLALMTGPFLARALGPDGKGQQAIVVVVAQTLAQVGAFGIPFGVSYLSDRFDHRRLLGTSYLAASISMVIISAPMWFLAPHYLSGSEYNSSTVAWMRLALVLNVFVAVGNCAHAMLQTESSGLRFNSFKYLGQISGGLLVIVLFFLGRLTVTTALFATVVVVAFGQFAAVFALRGRGRLHLQVKAGRALVSYGGRAFLGIVATMAVVNLDKIVIGAIMTPDDLGVYSVASAASGVLVPVGLGAGTTIISQIRKQNRPPLVVLRHTLMGTMAVAGSVALVTALFAPIVIPTFFGQDFAGAVTPLWWMLPGVVGMAIEQVMQAYLLALGYPGRASRSTIAGGIVMCVIVVPMVKNFGLVGGALSTTLALLVQLTITSLTVRKIGDRRAHTVTDEELEEDERLLDPMPGSNILAGPDSWPAPSGDPVGPGDHHNGHHPH